MRLLLVRCRVYGFSPDSSNKQYVRVVVAWTSDVRDMTAVCNKFNFEDRFCLRAPIEPCVARSTTR